MNRTTILNFDIKIENLPYEKVHTKFLKMILGVSKYTDNASVFGELGRYPISYKCLALCVKYWHRLSTGNSPNILLNCAYESENKYNSSWIQSIQYLLSVNGLGHLWENPNLASSAVIYKQFQLRLTDQFIQNWFDKASTSTNLSVINIMKTSYGCSDYLTRLNSPLMRIIFTKLRLNIRLMKNIRSVDDTQYNCPMCNANVMETVEHFLIVCPHYGMSMDSCGQG